MGFALQAAMDAGPLLRVGNMRFSAFGVCTLVGLLTAFWLMRWTATMAGLERRPVVDAGWFGVLAGLVVSRLLLIVSEPTAFLHYPLLILSLPSFTYVGMALTVVALLAYLRWKKLPLAKVLDAWAPCAALMAAALSVGYFFEGTHVGMPTALPWGVLDARFGRVHPVQMYDAVAAVWLCVLLLWRLAQAHVPGAVAREALMLGGIGFFVLAMFRQPDPGTPHAWLEPGQWVALGVFAVGWWWSSRWIWAKPNWEVDPVQIPPGHRAPESSNEMQ